MKWLWGTPDDWRGVGRSAIGQLILLALICAELAAISPIQDHLTSPMIIGAMVIDIPIALWISTRLRKRRG